MATAIVQPPRQGASTEPVRLSAGEELITAAIASAQAALWRAELIRQTLKLVIAVFAALMLWAILDQWVWSPGPLVRLLALLGAVAAATWWIAARIYPLLRARIRADYAAQSLEQDMPELRHALTSYVSLRGDVDLGGPRGAVVRSIGARAASQMKQHRIDLPSEAAGTFTWWIAMAVTLAIVVAYALLSPKNTLHSAQRLLMPLANIAAPTRVEIRDVRPGDCEVLAERPLEISAVIGGLAARDEPTVLYGHGLSQRQAMELDPSTGRFVASVRVARSTQYRIAAGDASAGPFEIRARDVPVASVRSVQIVPPRYTGLPQRQSTGGAITAEENSLVTITAAVNRPIQRARIEFNPRDNGTRSGASAGSLDMSVAPDGLTATATAAMRLPRGKHAAVAIDSYRVRVWDAEGNENPDPIHYPVRIIADLAPEISVVAPREVTKEVPINSQQLVEIAALDPDYGLRQIELTMRRGTDSPAVEVLWSAEPASRGNQIAEYRFRPQDLGLRVGDRVLLSAAALDNRENLDEQPEPNRSETQGIELTIVAARQLPPATAPEDGISEPDGEPANRGAAQDGAQEDGGQGQGQGQAGGTSGAGDAAGQQQNGAADSSAGGGQEDASEQSGDQSGQPGQGSQGAQGNQTGQGGQGAQDGQGARGDQPADESGGGDQGGAGEPTGQPSGDGRGIDDTQQPAGDPQQPAGEAGGGASDGAARGQADPATGDPAQGESAQGESAQGDRAEGDSAQGSDAQRGSGAAERNDRTGQTETSPETRSGESSAGHPQGANPEDFGDSAGGERSGEQPGEASESAPPQHDGDAFERIRDYLNQKQSADRRPPGAERPPQPPAEQAPVGDQGAGDQPGSSAGQDQNGNGAADSGPSADPQGAGDRQGAADPQRQSPADSSGGPSGDPTPSGDTPGAAAPSSDAPSSDPASGEAAGQDGDAAGQDAASSRPDGGDSAQPPGGDWTSGDAGGQSATPPAGAGDANQAPSDQAAGESAAGDSGGDQASSGDGRDSSASDAGSSGAQQGGSPRGDAAGDASGQSSGSDGGAAGDLGTGGEGSGADARPPDPVDVEYARQATDLVLDYLDQNRETPDPELLERLNWTPEELRDFTDRWRELLKNQDTPGAGSDADQVAEALRSLGIRKQADGPIGERRGRDDAMRGLRDAGNRPPAPTLYRDAFEAFRRGVNQPK